RLGQALVRLRAGELAVAAVVRLVSPDARALGQHRILAGEDPWIIRPPPSAVDDDLITHLDVLDVLADRPDDAGAVAAARVKVLRLALSLPLGDHVDGRAERGPHVVVVDAGRHHIDEPFVRSDAGRRNHLALPGVARLAEAILPDQERVH